MLAHAWTETPFRGGRDRKGKKRNGDGQDGFARDLARSTEFRWSSGAAWRRAKRRRRGVGAYSGRNEEIPGFLGSESKESQQVERNRIFAHPLCLLFAVPSSSDGWLSLCRRYAVFLPGNLTVTHGNEPDTDVPRLAWNILHSLNTFSALFWPDSIDIIMHRGTHGDIVDCNTRWQRRYDA